MSDRVARAASQIAGNENGDAPVKVSCRHIWKVYGAEPERHLERGDGAVDDPGDLCDRIRSSGHICAVCDASFDVRVGEIFIIMGLSGSGKSTLVRCLSRLVEPTAGQVFLDGADLLKASERELIEFRRHKMGMVFQSFGLMPHQTVLENVAFPLRVQGLPLVERNAKAIQMIELVGLQGREECFPRELSGGQQQRVGIARSLAVEPEIWFLDEPFSALDPLIRRQMQDEFLRLQRLLHKTIVFITHDFQEALRLGDRIAIMNNGWIEQIGAPADVVMNPATDYVSKFTRAVPRASVLTVADVLVSGGGDLPVPKGVTPSTTLDELLPHLARHSNGIQLLSESGAPIGAVTPHSVIAALASDDGEP